MAWVRRGAASTWRWSGTKWFLLAVALAATAGWALELRPVAPVWGPVGTWVGGLATAGALVFTGVQVRDARLQRQQEVDDGWVVDYTIANGADFPIENVVLVVADTDADDVRPEDRVGTCLQLVIGTLHHKEIVRDDYGPLRVKREPALDEAGTLGSIHFTDTWGQSWWRGTGELKRTGGPAHVR